MADDSMLPERDSAVVGDDGAGQDIEANGNEHEEVSEDQPSEDDLLEGSHFAVTAEEEKHISADIGELRQDRYPLRTSAQFLGPQVEDILSAFGAITIECNSSEC